LARTKSLSKQIRQAREGKGFTVAQLADRVGVSQVSIYYWESGRVRPRDTNLAALTKALKMPENTIATVGRGSHALNHGRPGISADETATIGRVTDAARPDRLDQPAVEHRGKSASVANLDALLARLDKGINAERTAMDNLLKRMASPAPEL
jgi:transcriptional regulator with XRE-family HTH domain